MPTSTELRQSAEAKFKKRELQRLDGCAAMAEYQAAGRATLDKTERLKALRLSRETVATQADAKSDVKPKAKPKPKPKVKSKAKRQSKVRGSVAAV
jgi:hypothetical protein